MTRLILIVFALLASCSRSSSPPAPIAWSSSDATYSAIWMGPDSPTASNYVLAADDCGDVVIQGDGAEARRYHAATCDPAFAACVTTCSRAVASTWDDAIHWKAAIPKLVACADACPRKDGGR